MTTLQEIWEDYKKEFRGCDEIDSNDIKSFIEKSYLAGKEDRTKEIVEIIKEIHRRHYMKWIPTEEQLGYRKAQMDIITDLKQSIIK
jgi:hypothetical protein